MTAGASIRPAAPADARAIAHVYVETWRSAYPGILPDAVMVGLSVDRKAAEWRRQLERPSRREGVVVAVLPAPERVVGFSSFGPATALDYAGEIYTLYVQSDWQNQGIGRALLRASLRRLLAQGMDSAFLWVLADNPSRFFYEAMGGRRVGHRDENIWGTALHEHAYAWSDLKDWLEKRGRR